MNRRLFEFDIAYSCFMLWGWAALVGGVVASGVLGHNISVGLGYILFLYLAISLLIALGLALLAGVALSVRLWTSPLLLLSAISLALLVILERESGTSAFRVSATIVYGMVASSLSFRWFRIMRRRLTAAATPR